MVNERDKGHPTQLKPTQQWGGLAATCSMLTFDPDRSRRLQALLHILKRKQRMIVFTFHLRLIPVFSPVWLTMLGTSLGRFFPQLTPPLSLLAQASAFQLFGRTRSQRPCRGREEGELSGVRVARVGPDSLAQTCPGLGRHNKRWGQ